MPARFIDKWLRQCSDYELVYRVPGRWGELTVGSACDPVEPPSTGSACPGMTGEEAVEAIVRARTSEGNSLDAIDINSPNRRIVIVGGGVLHRQLVFVVNGTIEQEAAAIYIIDINQAYFRGGQPQVMTTHVAVG